ncbi:MAG: stage II sporulation protein M [Firmicutes bacterium]|nr:stage II sporulation protein M [Bacillota bacterium]
MRQRRKTRFFHHLQENIKVYLFVFIFFTAGIIAGSLSVYWLAAEQVEELNQVFFSFVDYLSGQKPLNQMLILKQSLLQNGLFLLLLWLCGNLFFGFIFVLGAMFYRGFTIGFTVGFLAQQNGLAGVMFAAAAVLPQNLLFVPAAVVAAAFAFSFSWLLFCRRFGGRQNFAYGESLLQYTFVLVLAGVFFVAGSLVETMVAPVFMRLTVSLL